MTTPEADGINPQRIWMNRDKCNSVRIFMNNPFIIILYGMTLRKLDTPDHNDNIQRQRTSTAILRCVFYFMHYVSIIKNLKNNPLFQNDNTLFVTGWSENLISVSSTSQNRLCAYTLLAHFCLSFYLLSCGNVVQLSISVTRFCAGKSVLKQLWGSCTGRI